MAHSACRCFFRREEMSLTETGTAVTTAFGLSDTVVIIPDDATTSVDVLREVWSYTLDWSHSIDGDHLETVSGE